MLHGHRTPSRAGVRGRVAQGVVESHAVVELPDGLGRRQREKQSLGWIDVVVFEVEALQPGVVPRKTFLLAEGVQKVLLGDPVHATD